MDEDSKEQILHKIIWSAIQYFEDIETHQPRNKEREHKISLDLYFLKLYYDQENIDYFRFTSLQNQITPNLQLFNLNSAIMLIPNTHFLGSLIQKNYNPVHPLSGFSCKLKPFNQLKYITIEQTSNYLDIPELIIKTIVWTYWYLISRPENHEIKVENWP